MPPPRRAVVCDADSVSARYLARVLADAGFDVSTCGTAAACEAAVTAAPPDLAVLAVLLPDLDGFALARRLREKRPATSDRPRILMVSVLQAEARSREAGADAFLLKPVARQALVQAASKLVGDTAGGQA